MEVDRVVVVIAEERHVVEVIDESEIPGVRGVDFLDTMSIPGNNL